MRLVKKITALVLLFGMLAALLAGCASDTVKSFSGTEDFKNSKIGILTGSSFDILANKHYPDAEIRHFSSTADLFMNLQQERIDGILLDKAFFTPFAWESDEFAHIKLDMPAAEYAVAFAKTGESEKLMVEINEFIRSRREGGWLERLEDKWSSSYEPDVEIDMSTLSGERGTLRVATTVDSKPFTYLKNGNFYGFDAEFIYAFAEEYGYALDIDTMDFGALMPSLNAGRYDLALSGITVTEERRESVSFSDIYHKSPVVMAVLLKNTIHSTTLADFKTAKLGVVTGSVYDEHSKKLFPDAKISYYQTFADLFQCVRQSKIDGFLSDEPNFNAVNRTESDLLALRVPDLGVDIGYAFSNDADGDMLKAEMDSFIAELRADGTIDTLTEKWYGDAEPTKAPAKPDFSANNKKISVAIDATRKPFSYVLNSSHAGFEIEVLYMFCEKFGYNPIISDVPFASGLVGLSTGKFDLAAGGIYMTEERKKSVNFSHPYMSADVVMVCNKAADKVQKTTYADLKTGTIALLTGTVWDGFAKEKHPEAEIMHYSTFPDMVVSLSQGKADAILCDESFYAVARWDDISVSLLDERADTISCGFILNKEDHDENLVNELNEFIGKFRSDGRIDAMKVKWFSESEPTEHPDYESLTGENGTLKIALDDTAKPLTYRKNNVFTGIDVDIMTEFAREYGYRLEFSGMTFSAIIPTITSKKCDIGICGIGITVKRASSVMFTAPYMTMDGVYIINNDTDTTTSKSFFDGIRESFEKTLIREDRWKLIVEGVMVTMLISILALIIGTLLGFGLYMLSRSDVKIVRGIVSVVSGIYSRIISGTPVVVILMILFYIVFGKFRDMNGIVVAIIGFSLTFGAFVYDHMKVSVNSVNYGQTEAAYALGYSKNGAFFRIIFPQAMTIFMPSYCGEAVALIKATAVVGYIAVNDLTKMGDIIRSNTYEAFFPLITTAVIYFVLTWIVASLLGIVKHWFEPKRRDEKKILKGVKK